MKRGSKLFAAATLVLASLASMAQDRWTLPLHHANFQTDAAGSNETSGKPIVSLNLVSFDPVIGDVTGRVSVTWPRRFLGRQFELNRDRRLVEGYSIDDSVLKIKGNEPFATFNSSLKTLSEVMGTGSQYLYPFDIHHIRMKVGLFQIPPDGGELQPVPFDVDCIKCAFEGFSVSANGQFDAAGYYNVEFTLQRTTPTRVFALSLNAVMVLVAIIVLIMALRILRSSDVPEVTSLGFIGGLLFAIPAVRGLQPRVPAMGLLIDYMGFFWAEGLLVVSLLIVMICWLRRKEVDHAPNAT